MIQEISFAFYGTALAIASQRNNCFTQIMSGRILQNEAVLNFICRDAVNRLMIKICSVYKYVGFLI